MNSPTSASAQQAARGQSSAGSLFIVAAPSGAGKSSLVSALLANDPAMTLSISCTTRAPRPGEVHGREYFFLDEPEFIERQQRGEFLEHAQVHGHYYGTSRLMVEEQTRNGLDVLLEIDWQGAQQVREHFPQTMMIARELVAWGGTAEVLGEANWQRAQSMHEAFDELAPVCQADEAAGGWR